jgi:hypothetical protein
MTTVRRTGTASAAVLSGLVLTLGVAQAAAPEWTRHVGLDVWNLSGLRAQVQGLHEEAADLESQEDRLRLEVEALDNLTARLVAGDVSLAEATAAAEPIMRERTGFDTAARLNYPAPTFTHSVARYLIHRAGRGGFGGESETVRTRLAAEYAALRVE